MKRWTARVRFAAFVGAFVGLVLYPVVRGCALWHLPERATGGAARPLGDERIPLALACDALPEAPPPSPSSMPATVYVFVKTDAEASFVRARLVEFGLPSFALGPRVLAIWGQHQHDTRWVQLRRALAKKQIAYLGEGDRGGGGAVVASVRCRGTDRDALDALAADLGAYSVAYHYFHIRAPWDPEWAATEAERDARFTWWRHLERTTPGDSSIARALPERPLDPEVLRLARELDRPDVDFFEHGVKIGARMGQHPLVRHEDGALRPARRSPLDAVLLDLELEAAGDGNVGSLRAGWVVFGRFLDGLPAMARHLCARGCNAGPIEVEFVDFDGVRGD